MATDYDAPRKNEEDQSEESIEELKARRHDKNSGKVDEDEAEAAESFELPGADLSHEELAVEVMPRQEDEFTCMSCFLVHHRSQLADAKRLIGTGFSYEAHQREIQAAALLRLLPRIRDIRRFGSCALDLCAVAEGQLDAYVEEGVNLWDHAAAGLVARIAGARTVVIDGIGGLDLMVCAPGHSFDEVLEAVQSAGFSPVSGE